MGVEILVVLAVALAGAVVVVDRPHLAMFGLILAMFTRAPDALAESAGIPSMMVPLAAGVAFIIAMRWWVLGETVAVWRGPMLLLSSFGALVAMSLLWAAFPDRTAGALVELGKHAFFVIVALSLIDSAGRLRVAVWAIVAGGGLIGALAVAQAASGGVGLAFGGLAESEVLHIAGSTSAPRAGGPRLGPNGLAQVLLIAVPLAFERMLVERSRVLRLAASGCLAAAVGGVFLTYSRQAVLAAVVMAVYLVFRIAKNPWRLALGGAVVLVAALAVVPGGYRERVTSLADVRSVETLRDEPSFEGRLSEYVVALQMFRDNPLVGVGWENYQPLYQDYSRELGFDSRRGERGPHSTYLEFASELGVVGLAWVVAAFGVGLAGLRRASQWRSSEGPARSVGSMALAVEIAVVGFAATSALRHISFPIYFWLVLGLALVVPRIADREAAATGLRSDREAVPALS